MTETALFAADFKGTGNFSYTQVLVPQSWPTLCDPMDCSPPGSSAHEICQTTILEWVAISSSGDLPDPRIEPWSPVLQADSFPTELQGKP